MMNEYKILKREDFSFLCSIHFEHGDIPARTQFLYRTDEVNKNNL